MAWERLITLDDGMDVLIPRISPPVDAGPALFVPPWTDAIVTSGVEVAS